MPRHSKTRFIFTPDFGARLRMLRQRRGLTLRDLALLMGRDGPGSFALLGRLELGLVKHPSLGLVADYLRACGAGFDELLDLLRAYTSQPPIPRQMADAQVARLLSPLPEPEQQALQAWEKGMTRAQEERAAAEPQKRRPRVETARQRIFRIVWSFIHANWNEVLEQRLYETLVQLKERLPRSERRLACRFGRRFFGVLTRYYRREDRRQLALSLVERRAREAGLSDEVIAALLAAATRAHAELKRTGRLDWEPTEEEIVRARGRAPRVEKAETRLELEEVRPVREYNQTLALIHAMATRAVATRLEELKLDYFSVKQFYYVWIDRLIKIAVEHGTDSAEWKAEIDASAPKLHDEKIAREAAALVADTFNRWKAHLPPRPV